MNRHFLLFVTIMISCIAIMPVIALADTLKPMDVSGIWISYGEGEGCEWPEYKYKTRFKLTQEASTIKAEEIGGPVIFYGIIKDRSLFWKAHSYSMPKLGVKSVQAFNHVLSEDGKSTDSGIRIWTFHDDKNEKCIGYSRMKLVKESDM